MKPHLSEDTDDENWDDPIRLVHNDVNAVYFGTKIHGHDSGAIESHWTLEPIGNYEFCQSTQHFTLREPDDDLIQTLQGGTTSECHISPLFVKLVDCGKFPWYFKKYTQQIMEKIKPDEHNDSDHEIDVEVIVDDSNDCFIVEDLKDVTTEIIKNDQNCMKIAESLPKIKKCLENNSKRCRDDKEILVALSKKNKFQVDFKRNQGLVGMKITHKMGSSTTSNIITDGKNVVEKTNAKQNCVIVDEKYLSAADKTLSYFGTQLIPVTDEKENNTKQFKINNEKDIGEKPAPAKSSNSQNVTVQFEISKISEKLINNLKIKKMNDQLPQDKIVGTGPNKSLINDPENKLNIVNENNNINIVNENKISSNLTITEKSTGSSTKPTSHVKDVKKTNKYKKDQTKIKNGANHRSLIGLLVTNKSKEDIKGIKYMKQKRAGTQSIASKLDKKPRKKIKKQKHEPKSPILHCSTVPKKLKHEKPNTNKVDTSSNLPNESTKVKKIVDKLPNSNSCNLMYDVVPLKNITKIAPVSWIRQDKTTSEVSNIHAKSLIVSDKLPKNCNEVNKTCSENAPSTPSSQNKTYEQTALRGTHRDNVKEHVTNGVPDSDSNLKVPNKNYKPIVSNSNVPMTTAFAPTSGSKPALSNQYANFPTYHEYHVSSNNTLPSRISSNKTYEQTVLHETLQDNVKEHVTNGDPDSDSNLKAPNKAYNPIIPNNVSTTTAVMPTSGSKPALSNLYANLFTYHGSHGQTVLHETHQDNVKKHIINSVSDTNPNLKTPNKNYKPIVSNNNVSMTTATAPTSGSKPALSNQYANFPTYHGSHVQTVLHETHQDNVKEHIINSVPDTNPNLKTPNKNYKPIVSNYNGSTTTSIASPSGSKPTLSNQYANFPTYHGYHVSSNNTLPSRISSNNISNSNIDVSVQNRYASAIILKSNNNHMKFPFEKILEPPLQTMGSHSSRPTAVPSHTQQRFNDPQPPYPIFYPPTSSDRLQSNFPYQANSVPNQFHPPHGHIAKQPSNPLQEFYRDHTIWLSQNLAPPPPPPLSVPPISIPARNGLDVNKSKNCSNLNHPSASVIQIPKSVSHQNSVSTPQAKNNSSIIGINNNGLVKKINIVAMPAKQNIDTKKGTLNVKQITNPQIISTNEDSKIITTKTEMSKELDKLTFIDENINDFNETYPAKIESEDKNENTLEVAIMSKKPGSFETLNLTMDKEKNHTQTKQAQGYSLPILPIPTYQKVLDQVASNSQIKNTMPKMALRTGDPRPIVRNETKPMRKRDFVKCCKRKLDNSWSNDEEIRKREDAKKISLDEYKKRILKNNIKPEQDNKMLKEKYNKSGKRPNIDIKFRKNVDYSTETDLGYDSDSTVVL